MVDVALGETSGGRERVHAAKKQGLGLVDVPDPGDGRLTQQALPDLDSCLLYTSDAADD